jgi:DNA repair protein RadC
MAQQQLEGTTSQAKKAGRLKASNVVSFPASPSIVPAEVSPGLDVFRSLSDAALLRAVVGQAGECATEEAISELLAESGGLARLGLMHPRRVAQFGLPLRGVHLLLAAAELARRMAWESVPEREPMTRPDEVARYLFLRYARLDQEVFGALFLDGRNRHLEDLEVARGRMDAAAVEPRQALAEALLRGASGIVLFHNHPSGDPSPSPEDYEFTHRFREAATLLGIKLMDHLILGSPGRFVSIRDRSSW